jgi:hypothetical protein
MKSSCAGRYANAREGKFQFRLRQDNVIEQNQSDDAARALSNQERLTVR